MKVGMIPPIHKSASSSIEQQSHCLARVDACIAFTKKVSFKDIGRRGKNKDWPESSNPKDFACDIRNRLSTQIMILLLQYAEIAVQLPRFPEASPNIEHQYLSMLQIRIYDISMLFFVKCRLPKHQTPRLTICTRSQISNI